MEKSRVKMRLSERILADNPRVSRLQREGTAPRIGQTNSKSLYSSLREPRTTENRLSKLADRRWADVSIDMDRLLAKIERVNEKVNHASYGYAGFFDAIKIKEEHLDRMMDYDKPTSG